MGRKILIGIDGSQHSERALLWYKDNMKSDADELVFIFVVEPPPIGMTPGLGPATAEIYTTTVNEAIQEGKKLAAHTKEKCSELGLHNTTRFLERMTHGPGPAIVDVANEENVDMVLLGNRGKGLLRRTFLGSVSDYVLHHVHKPVIIIPPPKEQRRPSTHN